MINPPETNEEHIQLMFATHQREILESHAYAKVNEFKLGIDADLDGIWIQLYGRVDHRWEKLMREIDEPSRAQAVGGEITHPLYFSRYERTDIERL